MAPIARISDAAKIAVGFSSFISKSFYVVS